MPEAKTIEQIGRALRQLAAFGAGYGQEIRLEVHGRGTSDLAKVRRIMDIADHENARVCWNSNAEDLAGAGLAHNFELVKKHLGQTVHIHDLTSSYPWRRVVLTFESNEVRGVDAVGGGTTYNRPDPRDEVLPLGLANVSRGLSWSIAKHFGKMASLNRQSVRHSVWRLRLGGHARIFAN